MVQIPRFRFSSVFVLIFCLFTAKFEPTLVKFEKFWSKFFDKIYPARILKKFVILACVWLLLLLYLAGDVELNPGPGDQVCRSCSTAITDKSILCGFCDKLFHYSCADLTEADAKLFLSKKKLFICPICEPTAIRFFKLEARLEKCELKLDTLDSKVDNILQIVNELKVAPKSHTDIKSTFTELFEIESKKRNAVVFGVPDGDDDLTFIRDLAENSTVKASDILYTFRDGPDHTPGGKSIPQFNKVVFSTSKARNSFLSWLKTHKPADQRIRARPDLTYAQREKNRQLRSELQHKLDSGENGLRIDYKKGEIVKFSNNRYNTRNSVSQYPK
jgi:hypothetical protein